VSSCDVSGFGAAGIGVNSKSLTTGFSSVNITNDTVHNNGHSGIWSQAGPDEVPAPYGLAHQGIFVAYDVVANNAGYNGTDASGNGIELGNVDGATIEYCIAYGNGSKNNATQGGPIGIWTYNSNRVDIIYNQSYSNTAAHKDGGGFDLDGGTSNSILEYNYSHDNAGTGILEAQFANASPQTGNVIRYNISQNDGRNHDQAGIVLWAAKSSDTIQGTQIYGNTIYMAPAATGSPKGILILSATKNVSIYNNIFDMGAGLSPIYVESAGTGLVFAGNDYWNGSATAANIVWGAKTYQTLTAFQSATGEETLSGKATGLSVNPRLNIASTTAAPSKTDIIPGYIGFLLQAGSPLISAGVNLNALGINPGPTDFFSYALPFNADLNIGAN
jgi:hypothetical protein